MELVLRGFGDSLSIWKTAQASRTFRSIAVRLIPLYTVTCALGLWFYALDYFFLSSDDAAVPRFVLWSIWNVFCMFPLYLVGALVQTRYSSKILTKEVRKESSHSWSYIVSESFFGIVLNLTYIVQTSLVTFAFWFCLPLVWSGPINRAINLISVAWASAFSACEMALIFQKKGLVERIYFLETRWAYGFAYGAWLSLVYHYAPQAVALSLWQYCLMLMMLHSMTVKFPSSTRAPGRLTFPHRLKIFYGAQWLATYCVRLVAQNTEKPEKHEN